MVTDVTKYGSLATHCRGRNKLEIILSFNKAVVTTLLKISEFLYALYRSSRLSLKRRVVLEWLCVAVSHHPKFLVCFVTFGSSEVSDGFHGSVRTVFSWFSV